MSATTKNSFDNIKVSDTILTFSGKLYQTTANLFFDESYFNHNYTTFFIERLYTEKQPTGRKRNSSQSGYKEWGDGY